MRNSLKNENRYSSQIKIYDVAGRAGVSLATVSRVLNHPEKVKAGTREKIEKIIRELDYKPNLNAKGLATSGGQVIEIGESTSDTPSANLVVGGLFFKRLS